MAVISNEKAFYPLPDTWTWVSLSDVATIGSRQVIPYDLPDQLFNYLALENIESGTGRIINFSQSFGKEIKSNKFIFGREDVLYGKLRPYLRKVVAPDFEGISATDLLPIKPDCKRLTRQYLKWWLLGPAILEYVTGRQTGVKMPRLRSIDLDNLPIPLPTIDEQKRIIAKLELLDKQVQSARAALERIPPLLKAFRQSVLAAAFRGELTERDPSDEPVEELLERIRAERRRKWEENLRVKGKDRAKYTYEEPPRPDISKLPKLPEGWVWTTVDELCDIGTGSTPLRGTKKYWGNGSIPWITSGALNDPYINKAEEFITEDAIKETNARIFPPGTLLVAMYGEGRTRGLISELKISAATNQACAALIFEGDSANYRNFVRLLFEKNYDDIRMLSSGGVQPNLNLSIIRKTQIPFPSLNEQARIVTRIQSMATELKRIEIMVKTASRRLDQLEQAALSKAFRGEL